MAAPDRGKQQEPSRYQVNGVCSVCWHSGGLTPVQRGTAGGRKLGLARSICMWPAESRGVAWMYVCCSWSFIRTPDHMCVSVWRRVYVPVALGHRITSSSSVWYQELQTAFQSHCATRISIQKDWCLLLTCFNLHGGCQSGPPSGGLNFSQVLWVWKGLNIHKIF